MILIVDCSSSYRMDRREEGSQLVCLCAWDGRMVALFEVSDPPMTCEAQRMWKLSLMVKRKERGIRRTFFEHKRHCISRLYAEKKRGKHWILPSSLYNAPTLKKTNQDNCDLCDFVRIQSHKIKIACQWTWSFHVCDSMHKDAGKIAKQETNRHSYVLSPFLRKLEGPLPIWICISFAFEIW